MQTRTASRPPAKWRPFAAVILGSVFGGRGRAALYRRLCRYSIARDATIGLSLISASKVDIANQCRVGHFSIVRNVEHLSLASGSRIGTFNWIFGMLPSTRHFTEEADRVSALVMHEGASITSRHIVDCTNKVTIGAFSTVAGFYSQILTHGIDIRTNRQVSSPVTVGMHAMIGTRAVILKGARVPDRTVVGAGSVFRGAPDGTGGLWSGVPARRVLDLDQSSEYFTRTDGHVS